VKDEAMIPPCLTGVKAPEFELRIPIASFLDHA